METQEQGVHDRVEAEDQEYQCERERGTDTRSALSERSFFMPMRTVSLM